MKNRIMMSVMALVFCASVAQAEPGNIPVGGMKLEPSVTLSEAHNDNIFSKEVAKDIKKSWITTISPSLVLKADDGAKQYELGYNLKDRIFHQSHDDDVVDHFFNFDADLELSRKLTAGFHANYNLNHDPRGSIVGAAGNVAIPDAYRETIVGGSVDYGSNAHIIVSGEYDDKQYSNNYATTNVRNRNSAMVGAEFAYDLTSKTSVLLEGRYERFNYVTANVDSNEQAYYTGLHWDATAKTSGSVRIGYMSKNFTSIANADVGFFSWEVDANWLPLSYSSWTLSTSQAPEESDGTGRFIKNTKVDVSWDHSWSDLVSHSASLGYTKGVYHGDPRSDNTTTANLSVNYELLRWLSVSPAYEFTNLSSNIVNQSYRTNIWTINLVGTL